MGNLNLAFGERARSAAEYLLFLHDIELIEDASSNTILCHRDEFINQHEQIISHYDHVIVEDWFGIDDHDNVELLDNSKVTFCTTNMQPVNFKHASVVYYNFMFNRTKLFYGQDFPLVRNGKRYFLLLSGTGENYKNVKYNSDRAYNFMFLNAGRQTPERKETQHALDGLNGIVSTKNNLLPGDLHMPYNPVPANYWESCYFNIVVESNLVDDSIVHTTEKVWEPIIKYQIPIIYSTKHYQTYMESLGFVFPIKVFTDLDEYKDFLKEFFGGDSRKFFLAHRDEVMYNHNTFYNLSIDTGVEQLWKK